MNDLFYFILCAFIIALFFRVSNMTDVKANKEKLSEFNGYVVTHKEDNFFQLNNLTLQKDTLRQTIRCDDIFYQRFQVGDTINVNVNR